MSGPLKDVRVLDLGAFGVGPIACGYLGLLGADVIRVEPPWGDGLMYIEPSRHGMSLVYISSHFNVKSIVLDLTRDADREIVYALVKKTDIIVENRRLGAMEKIGLGYKKLSEINPRIIYISSPAYGISGPFVNYAGADHYLQSVTGFASLNGKVGGDAELSRYIVACDNTSSAFVAQAALAGLLEREVSGRGQLIRMSSFNGGVSLQTTKLAEYFATGEPPKRMGSENPRLVPSGAYKTWDDQYVLVSAFTTDNWVNLCHALKLDDLIEDERFATNEARVKNREELNQIIGKKIIGAPLRWWLEWLTRNKVPCAKVYLYEDLVNDRYAVEVGIVDVETAWGTAKYANAPWKFSKSPAEKITGCPYPDQDRSEVLRSIDAT